MEIDTNTEGTLDKIYHLGFTDGPSVDDNGRATLVEEFKGNFKTLRELHLGLFKVNKERPTETIEGGGSFVTYFKAPQPSNNQDIRWFINSVKVEEQEAGDHAIMTVSYIGKLIKNTSLEEPEAEEISETWQIENQENEVSIYMYCTSDPSISMNNARWIKAWEEESPTLYAKRYYTNPDDGEVYTLTEAGKAIAEYVARGITSIKAFSPVIVRTRIYSAGKIDKIGEDINTIDTPDNTENWKAFIEAWNWLKVGDDLTAEFSGNEVVKQTRTEKWLGSRTEWPKEFYSKSPKERWKIPMNSVVEYEEE